MKILIVVDIQNDFCPGGALAVPEGDQVVELANKLMRDSQFDLVVLTKDWHPDNHLSFAQSHPGRNVYEQVRLGEVTQTLWPKHCVQNTVGAEFHSDLKIPEHAIVVNKGTKVDVDSYSGFYDNARLNRTELVEIIEQHITEGQVPKDQVKIYVCGLALDYCVKATALDAKELGYKTEVILDATRAVNIKPGDDLQAMRDLRDVGVDITDSKNIIEGLDLVQAHARETEQRVNMSP